MAQFNVNIDSALHKQLKHDAIEAEMTLGKYVEHLLRLGTAKFQEARAEAEAARKAAAEKRLEEGNIAMHGSRKKYEAAKRKAEEARAKSAKP